MGTRLLFVVSYDVADDGRRGRIARLLEKQAVRVQRSVFEIRTTVPEAHRLMALARLHLSPGDSLRLYAVDRVGRDRSVVFGPGPRLEEAPFFLL